MKKEARVNSFKYESVTDKDGKMELIPVLKPTEIKGKTAFKNHKKATATIDIDGVVYSMDNESMTYMTTVVSLANAKYNMAVATGTLTPADAFAAVYEKTVDWLDVKKQPHTISIAEIANGLELAMNNIQHIVS